MLCEKPRQIFEAGLLDDRQVVAVNNVGSGFTACFNKVAKKLAQFRRAAGNIHDLGLVVPNPCANAFRSSPINHLRPPWTRVHVAMTAGLVTFAPDVDLQRL